MNHSWNIKRLGDICTSELGKTRDEKRNKGSFRPYLCAVNVQWDKFELSELKEMRFEDNEYDRYTIRKGDLVICEGGDIGRAAIWDKDEPIHYQNALHRVRFNEGVDSRFILYYLYFLKQTGILDGRYGKGVTIKHLVKSSLLSIPVPVPPIDEQQRIVFELDLLTDIIDKKNAQLRDLDALAQSIFYEMFGDPVINDKGWKTVVLSAVSQLLNGRAYKQDELLNSGKYKVIRVGNFFTNSEFYYSNLELEDDKYCDYGDLLFAWSASFGAFIWSGEKVIYHYHIWKVLFDEDKLDKVFYQYLLNTMTSSFMKDVHGIGMVHLTKSGMEQYVLPIPPLDIQKNFAERISAIESQKRNINESLATTQTLLNSRMNAYFNC